MQQTNKQPNIFKNFTDTVGCIASLFAIITVLLYKNDFKPTEEIASFIELESVKTYVFIAAVFFISALANTLTRSLPTLSVAFSIFPVCFCYEAFAAKMLEKNPVLYLMLSVIHATGAVVYAFHRFDESEVSPRREGLKSMIISYALAFCAVDMWVANSFVSVKYEKLLRLPFRFLLGVGILSGVLGIAWYFKQKKTESNASSVLFWNSFSATIVCAMIFIAKQTVELFGV